ncbi:MAG: hypothetical protein M3N91_00835 [Pseudomonadota bacterium]|nr:hypothetical protein [Pseudomonadota bacterium]
MRTVRKLFTIVCALCAAGAGAAELQVRVENASGVPLANAVVYAVPLTPAGAATLKALAPGDYRLYAWHEPMMDPAPGESLHVDSAPLPLRRMPQARTEE